MNKKGQFYLIAALVIILLMLGLTDIYNETSYTDESNRAENLVREISFEANQIIDNGVFKGDPIANISSRLNYTLYLYSLKNPDTELAFIYCNKTNSYLDEYYSLTDTNQRILKTLNIVSNMNTIRITLDANDTYSFNITEGQNFFLVAKIRRGDERITSTN
jgi:hypothetical protein